MAWLNVDGCTYVGRTQKKDKQIFTLMKCEWLFGTLSKKDKKVQRHDKNTSI